MSLRGHPLLLPSSALPLSMSYSYGSSSGMGTGFTIGPGYSYAALTSTMDPGEALDAPSSARKCATGSSSRRSSHGGLAAACHDSRSDKRKAHSPRHRAEAGGHSFIYKSLRAGLTLPRAAITRTSLRAKNSGMDTEAKKAHQDRRVANPSSKAAKQHTSTKEPAKPKRSRRDNKAHRIRSTPTQSREGEAETSRGHGSSSPRAKSAGRLRPKGAGWREVVSRRSSKKNNGAAFAWGCFGR